MPQLTGANITFHTHNQGKDHDTVVHVFVKNRPNTTQGSEGNRNFVSNLLGYQRYLDTGDLGDHTSGPYLAYGIGLAAETDFNDPSTHSFPLTLMPDPVSLDDIVLPEVDVHIQPNGHNRWTFDYVVEFTFDDGSGFSYSSKDDGGLPGILLDQDNKDYSGVCAENPLRPLPVHDPLASKAFLRKVTLDIRTHNDNRDGDTRLDVEIVNRLNSTSSTGIAIGTDLFPGEEFKDGEAVRRVSWPSDDGNLSLNQIPLADMVLPQVRITIDPNGDDRWIFDYRVTFEFADPDDFEEKRMTFSSRTSGVILDQDNNVHSGVYQGPAFPEVAARPAPPLTGRPVERVKTIPLSLVRRKVDEFINNRNGGTTDDNPPLRRIRLHNTGRYNDETLPESYFDVRAITAKREAVDYVSSPTSAGQLTGFVGIFDSYLQDINSETLRVDITPGDPAPITISIDFETDGPEEVLGFLSDMDFLEFSIALRLTLTPGKFDDGRTVVDVLSWAEDLRTMDAKLIQNNPPLFHYTGTFLGQPVDVVSSESQAELFIEQVVKVHLVTSSRADPGGIFRQRIRDKIYSTLVDKDPITGRSTRDDLNSMATSWLLGGLADDEDNIDGNNTVLHDIGIDDEAISLSYSAPPNVFVPVQPADFPTAWDFSPGTLANIDHIVVLMMENRSFDHMLGYLSLPTSQGGAGRTDVDGLKGGESNSFRGTTYPVFPLTDTFFSPDPPHGFEPVHRSINGGLMDGFVSEYARQNGPGNAGQIMGHHTAATVPVYDALARDFALGHRWFSSHPGPTFCNRFTGLTGRLNLNSHGFWEFDNSSPLRPVFTKTIFDHLSDAKVDWAYYEQGYCFLRFFEQHTFDNERIVDLDDPDRGFFTRARTGDLPSVTFIDPHFVELPPGDNADGPPADVRDGQRLVERITEAVVASPAWDKTLMVIVYDEHGGFYDHVPPSAAAKVSPELPIETHGPRAPAFAISPWVGAGTVFGADGPAATSPVRRNDLHFDHTSLLKTIVRRFLSANPPYLGARYAQANDLSAVVGTTKRNSQFRPFLRYNFQFGASQMKLGVENASTTPGAALLQLPADGSEAQNFSFEDAGDGSFYIRSRVSNLYLTVQISGSIPPSTNPPIVQDVKFPPPHDIPHALIAARQKWSLIQIAPDTFLIKSLAVAGKFLQPRNATQSSPIVLRTLRLGTPLEQSAWKVTSPAFG